MAVEGVQPAQNVSRPGQLAGPGGTGVLGTQQARYGRRVGPDRGPPRRGGRERARADDIAGDPAAARRTQTPGSALPALGPLATFLWSACAHTPFRRTLF